MSLDSYIASNRARAERAYQNAASALNVNPDYVSNQKNQKPKNYVDDTGVALGAYPIGDGLVQRVSWNDSTDTWEDLGSPLTTKSHIDNRVAHINAAEYIADTNTGGEAIQAAIDNLPSRGGRVIVPQVGPDDGIVNQNGNLEDGVWAVNSTITTSGKSSVWIEGETPGFRAQGNGGAKLIANSNINNMITFTSGSLDGIKYLYFDGGDAGSSTLAQYCVNFGNGNSVNGFQMHSCIVTGAATANIKIDCTQNVWINNSWIELSPNATGGIECNLDRDLWISSCLFNRNGNADINIKTPLSRLYVNSTRFRGSNNSINCADNLINASVIGCVSDEPDNSFLNVESGSTVENSKFDNIQILGQSVTSHIVNNLGSIVDTSFNETRANNLTGSNYVNVVNDTTNTTRVTIDGLGYNGSNNPSSSGDWNNNGREGVKILWDNSGTKTISEYVNGTWYSRAL